MIMLPILATSLTNFSLKSLKNVPFELGSERVENGCVSFFLVNSLVYF